jgi:hypothetical protein
MQFWLPHLCRPGLHRPSGLQRTQAIRMTRISEPRTLAGETNGCSSERAQTEVDSWLSVSERQCSVVNYGMRDSLVAIQYPKDGVTFVSR